MNARAQVMQWVAQQDDLEWDFKVPDDIMKQAIREGLAAEFSFFIRYTAAERNPNGEDEPVVYAVIYPNGLDNTWKGPDFIRPMLPESWGDDECMETEWHFEKAGLHTPADIARLLAGRGFTFDDAGQRYFEDDRAVYEEVKAAVDSVTGAAVPPAAKPHGPKPSAPKR